MRGQQEGGRVYVKGASLPTPKGFGETTFSSSDGELKHLPFPEDRGGLGRDQPS